MKIKIWRQFASNHSASYTVIGTFDTEQEAQDAAKMIEQLLVDIAQWYGKHDPIPCAREPIPIEKKIAEKYHIDWQKSVDWLRFCMKLNLDPRQYVVALDNKVILESAGHFTWQAGDQFVDLLTALGATTHREIYNADGPKPNTSLFTDSLEYVIDIEAMSTEQARQIAKLIEQHKLEQKFHDFGIWPWVTFHPRFDSITNGMGKTTFLHHEQTYVQENTARKAYIDSHAPSKMTGNEYREWLSKNSEKINVQFLAQPDKLRGAIFQVRYDTSFRNVKIYHSGMHLRLTFEYIGSPMSFIPALIGWLRHEGCTVEWNTNSSNVIHVYDPSDKDNSA